MTERIQFFEAEYLAFLEILLMIGHEMHGKIGPDPRREFMQHLALKLSRHAGAAIFLYHGTNIVMPMSRQGWSFVDFSSIAVIARAAIETYLTFFEVFIANDGSDDFTFNWNLWQLSGIVGAENTVREMPATKDEYRAELEFAEGCRTHLRGTRKFQALKSKDQKKVLQGKRLRDWQSVAKASGFNNFWLRQLVYPSLSGFVHADGRSVGALENKQTEESQKSFSEGPLHVIMILISKTILDYDKLFPEAREITAKFAPWRDRARQWAALVSQKA